MDKFPDVAPVTTSGNGQPEPTTSSANMLTPMDRATATKLVRRLLAGYPVLNAHDPEGYMAAMVQVMGEYPAWAGQQAVLRVDKDGDARFIPSDKQLRMWLDDAIRPYKFSAEWLARSVKQIAERVKAEPEPVFLGTRGDGGPGTIYSNYDEAVRKHGRPIGVNEPGRQLVYRG